MPSVIFSVCFPLTAIQQSLTLLFAVWSGWIHFGVERFHVARLAAPVSSLCFVRPSLKGLAAVFAGTFCFHASLPPSFRCPMALSSAAMSPRSRITHTVNPSRRSRPCHHSCSLRTSPPFGLLSSAKSTLPPGSSTIRSGTPAQPGHTHFSAMPPRRFTAPTSARSMSLSSGVMPLVSSRKIAAARRGE